MKWLAGLALIAACRERDLATDARVATPAATATAPTRTLYSSAPPSFVDLVAGARHAVVGIRAKTKVKSGPAAMFPGAPETIADEALGTGFLIEAKGVYVVTTDHIAAAANELEVVLPGQNAVAAKLIGRDPRLDLALLSIDVPRLSPLQLGNSDDVKVGEWLVVLGNAFGDEVTASVGVVSATGSTTAGSMLMGSPMTFRMFVQTDARIHRGNSGGPVLDTAGQVVGVAVATSDRARELSFVIPSNRVREVFDVLRDYGKVVRSWLGVKVLPVTAERATQLALPKPTGALVTEVEAASPAARAGLQTGDVILRWDGRDVDDRSLPWVVAQTPVGKPTAVVVWRNHAEATIEVVPEKMRE